MTTVLQHHVIKLLGCTLVSMVYLLVLDLFIEVLTTVNSDESDHSHVPSSIKPRCRNQG